MTFVLSLPSPFPSHEISFFYFLRFSLLFSLIFSPRFLFYIWSRIIDRKLYSRVHYKSSLRHFVTTEKEWSTILFNILLTKNGDPCVCKQNGRRPRHMGGPRVGLGREAPILRYLSVLGQQDAYSGKCPDHCFPLFPLRYGQHPEGSLSLVPFLWCHLPT